ncbi:MAG: hypothetical protein ABL921_31285, partial [Pirellula sp.]
ARKTISQRVTLEKPDDRFVVDMGNVPANDLVELEFVVVNSCGKDCNFVVKAGCGCTKFTPDRLAVQKGKEITLRVSINIPNPSEFATSLTFSDEMALVKFHVGIHGKILEEARVEPRQIRTEASMKQDCVLKFLPQFDDVTVTDVRIVSDGNGSIRQKEMIGKGLRIRFSESGEALNENVVDKTLFFDVILSNGKSLTLTVPLVYSDRVRITPSKLLLRNTEEGAQLIFLVNGPDFPKTEDDLKVFISDGASKVDASINRLLRRTDNVFVVYASVSDKSMKSISANGSWKVHIGNDTQKWRATVPLFQ